MSPSSRLAALALGFAATIAIGQKPDPKPADGTGSAMTDADAKEFVDSTTPPARRSASAR